MVWSCHGLLTSIYDYMLLSVAEARTRSALARNGIPLRITDVEDLQGTVSNLDLEVSHSLLTSEDFEATYLLFQRILADHLYVSLVLLLAFMSVKFHSRLESQLSDGWTGALCIPGDE